MKRLTCHSPSAHVLLGHRGDHADDERGATGQDRHQRPEACLAYQRPVPLHEAVILGRLRHHQLNPDERWLAAVLLVVKLNSYGVSTYGDVRKREAMD